MSPGTLPRQSLLGGLSQTEAEATENKFCKKADLRDEASVEQFFVSRLLEDLGYEDGEIYPKSALTALTVARGHSKEQFRPDYAVNIDGKVRWIVDAKGPSEDVDKWSYQGAGYALGLNRSYSGENPVFFYAITNGHVFRVWKWDESDPILEVEFHEFFDGHPRFLALQELLGAKVVRRGWERTAKTARDTVTLRRPSVEEIKRVFNAAHNSIWKAEKMNPQPAFFEFVKIMFVKLWEDRKLHDDPDLGPLIRAQKPVPQNRVVFSTQWINRMEENGVDNPIDSALFRHLNEKLQEDVVRGRKKMIFDPDERIRLHSGTITDVVSRLQDLDMFGIDEDLNGRLFETFLSATMRGQALGQYFTPRSITKLMTRLAAPIVQRDHVDRVLDACCGTGGFLIEALTDMRNIVRSNTSLSEAEQVALQDRIANDSIFGIDAGQDPPIARIARMNMYLHGDGGSRIFAADSLDKSISRSVEDSVQSRQEVEDLRRSVQGLLTERGGFEIVLTNPPFSMDYSASRPDEAEILDQYDLAGYEKERTSQRRKTLRSRAMFIERYFDLLTSGGKLITVIDDSMLSSKQYKYARNFIRDRFVIRAIISLPGDAFQRVGARAKTSILFLTKREPGEIGQPDVFMAEAQHIGLDDVPPKTRVSVANEKRNAAQCEIESVLENFKQFQDGQEGPWRVPAHHVSDRLDVKYCLPRQDNIVDEWRKKGIDVLRLKDVVRQVEENHFNPQESPNDHIVFLRVQYDGVPIEGEVALGKEVTYTSMLHPEAGDLVVSNIAMALGATAVVPEDLEHTCLSSEYTLMRIIDERFNPWFLWGYLRSAEVRARILSQATGISRQRAGQFLAELPVPLVPREKQDEIGDRYRQAVERRREAEQLHSSANEELVDDLNLENDWALNRLKAAKPPK